MLQGNSKDVTGLLGQPTMTMVLSLTTPVTLNKFYNLSVVLFPVWEVGRSAQMLFMEI